MKTARLVVTLVCDRSCSYCINKTIDPIYMMESQLKTIAQYDAVCITGGEPLLHIDRTIRIIKKIKEFNPICKIYLYTAKWNASLSTWKRIIPLVDGITFTIHSNKDICEHFNAVQYFISRFSHKLYRLTINKNVTCDITIKPNVWARISIKEFNEVDYKECLPKNETLYMLVS